MDLDIPGTSSKNQKVFEEKIISEAQDIISKLPDAVLVHILSFLPTKLAAQTGILSKRWKDLWVLVPALDFDMHLRANYKDDESTFDSFAKPKIESFMNFLDRQLAVRDSLSIKKFRLACDRIDSKCLSTWLSAVPNVEELDLEIFDLGEFPGNFFVRNSLVILKLYTEVLLDIPSTVSFPRLKILHLHSLTYADDASVEKLLSSCPVLEDLQISRQNWDNVRNFVIAVPSLKRLTLDLNVHEMYLYNEEDDETIECKLVVDAPNLEYLSLLDYMSNSIQVNYMDYVTESYLSVNKISECDNRTEEQISKHGDDLCGIFQSITNVKRLKIGEFTLWALSEAVDRRSLPIFHNLVHLEITFNFMEDALLLPTLLEITPQLKNLILSWAILAYWHTGSNPEENQHISYGWKPPTNVPECLLFSLKYVEIQRGNSLKYVEIQGSKIEEELKLVKYFLENAMVLEKMTIWCRVTTTSELAFREELMNWTRGSAACELDIHMPERQI